MGLTAAPSVAGALGGIAPAAARRDPAVEPIAGGEAVARPLAERL